jgi:hypothetical protein
MARKKKRGKTGRNGKQTQPPTSGPAFFAKSADSRGVWFQVPSTERWEKRMRSSIPRTDRFWDESYKLWWVSSAYAKSFFEICADHYLCAHAPKMNTPGRAPQIADEEWQKQLQSETGVLILHEKAPAKVSPAVTRSAYQSEEDARRSRGARKERVCPPPGVPVLLYATDEARHYLSDGEWHAEEELWSFPRIHRSVMEQLIANQEVVAEEDEGEPGYRQLPKGYLRYRIYTCGESRSRAQQRISKEDAVVEIGGGEDDIGLDPRKEFNRVAQELA